MQGEMIWFNVEKGHGFIRTEQDERLHVALSGFLPGHAPEARCKGRPVTFIRQVGDDGEVTAVDVSFLADEERRRARLRHSRGGHSF